MLLLYALLLCSAASFSLLPLPTLRTAAPASRLVSKKNLNRNLGFGRYTSLTLSRPKLILYAESSGDVSPPADDASTAEIYSIESLMKCPVTPTLSLLSLIVIDVASRSLFTTLNIGEYCNFRLSLAYDYTLTLIPSYLTNTPFAATCRACPTTTATKGGTGCRVIYLPS